MPKVGSEMMTIIGNLHCTKNHISFPNVLKRWSFQIYYTGIWYFFSHQERWYCFSPKIWSYSLCVKWTFFLKKIHGNMIFSSNVLNRWSFPKKSHWNIIFLVPSGKKTFLFLENIKFSLWRENERWSLSKKKYIEISCSLYIRKRWCFLFLQMWRYPYVKKAKMTLFRKVHLTMTFPASLKKIILILGNMILEF